MHHRLSDEIDACLRFYSRLSLPGEKGVGAMPDFAGSAWAVPVAGALIGACGAGVLILARAFGLAPLPACVCAIGALVLVTGGLHEDGLADVADGFGGGATRERKLEIMRDSRLGSYGAIALVLTLMLRAAALAALTQHSTLLAALALVAAGGVSRIAGLLPLMLTPPARSDGAGAAALVPSADALRRAFLIAAILSLAPLLGGAGLKDILSADFVAILAGVGVARFAQRQIGGFTGDVLGAAQQAAETAILLALSAR
jgi:adenosylcobinamide-GDP ribazoletransferase